MWADRAGEYVGNQRGLVEWLRQQGFEEKEEAHRKYFVAINILTMGPPGPNTNSGVESNKNTFAVISGGKDNTEPKK
jgi:hypothetical protein